MGSPLAPVLAHLFMGHHEKLWLENFQGSEILFYRRYVDDTFYLFHSEHDAIIFFDYINSRNPNIRFTMEKEAHHKLPFLDVLVDNNNPNSILTRVYRKKTFTGLLTNYFSFTSYSYKVGLIRTLVDAAYKINNTWLGRHEDITKLMEILKKNLFPAHLIERVVNRYITGTLSNHWLFTIYMGKPVGRWFVQMESKIPILEIFVWGGMYHLNNRPNLPKEPRATLTSSKWRLKSLYSTRL